MALKVNREYGVTIGGEHYPLKTRKKIERIEPREAVEPSESNPEGVPAVEGNIEEIGELLEQGYLVDTEAEIEEPDSAPAPKAKKGKGGK